MSLSPTARRALWLAPLAVLALGGAVFAGKMMQPPPDDLDLSLSKSTEAGRYIGTLAPEGELAVGTLHSWTVTLTTPDGRPVDSAEITIDGGMPQHGHGLPTSPRVTEALGNGRYLVEGMKFNMPGWWTLSIDVQAQAGADSATFNVML